MARQHEGVKDRPGPDCASQPGRLEGLISPTDRLVEPQAKSWAEARQLPNFPADDYLSSFLRWRGNTEAGPDETYAWLVSHGVSEIDQAALLPQSGAAYHLQLANLIVEKFTIVELTRSRPRRNYPYDIDQGKTIHLRRILQQAQAFCRRVDCQDYPPMTDPVFKFDSLAHGLDSPFAINREAAINIRPANQFFVEYAGRNRLQHILDKTEASMTSRIYINPAIDQNVKVFAALIDILEHNRIDWWGKILNRAIEAGPTPPDRIRSEGITIELPASQADRALNLILSYHQNNPGVFARRQAPSLSVEIAPGIGLTTSRGLGYEDIPFNRHRAYVFEKAWQSVRAIEAPPELPPEQQLAAFKSALRATMAAAGINLENIAFNSSRPDQGNGGGAI